MPDIINLRIDNSSDFFVQESYKVLRTNLLFCGEEFKTILLTSCGSNEGKTTISIRLGASLAEQGKHVLVLDTDMRKSVMAGRETDAKNVMGLSELLSGQCNLMRTIYQTNIKNLHVVFSGQYPPNPAELLGSKRFEDVLHILRDTYDYVIVDSPPLGLVIDAAVVAAKCDGVAIVISRGIRATQAREVTDMLEKSGCRLLGVIMNEYGSSTHRRKDKYYSSYYKYGYGYGQGKKSSTGADKTVNTNDQQNPIQ